MQGDIRIGLMTPEQVHYGLAQKVYEDRHQVLLSAYDKNPERFKGKVPKPHALPTAAWINKPKSEELESNLLTDVSHSH
jgi:putative transposase